MTLVLQFWRLSNLAVVPARMNRLFYLLIVIVSGPSHYARAAGQQYTVAGPGVAYRAPQAISQ
jgi:hypothetical protein